MTLFDSKISFTRSFLFSFILLLGSCVTAFHQSSFYLPSVDDRNRSDYQQRGSSGMVVTAHPLASEAGLAMLSQGGNAIDAAVAASFAISVVRPQSTGIGGGGFLLYHEASKGDGAQVYDFRERAPQATNRNFYLDSQGKVRSTSFQGHQIANPSQVGHLAVATPGLVAGLVEVHNRHGSLPFAAVVAPAIALARNGFPVYPSLVAAIERRRSALEIFPATRSLLFAGGSPLEVGAVFRQPDLADTLEQISRHGRDGFYKGVVAKRILREVASGGGVLSQQDLDEYRVIIRQPVVGSYRGYQIVGMPPPSSGGVHIIQMLNMLSRDNVASYGHNSVKGIHLLSEVMRRAFADRATFMGDPDFVAVPQQRLLNLRYALAQRASIDLNRASPSKEIRPDQSATSEPSNTTHISVVDRFGNAVSSTQTINYTFGSGVVAAGTGVFLNNEMDDFSIKPGHPNVFGLVGGEANAIAPGKTMLSSMSPTIVLDPKGKVKMVLGSPGGPRIINATLQTILNVIDHKMPLADAVHAYRIHHQWLPDSIFVESGGFSPKVISELKAKGHSIAEINNIGDVQAIAREGRGWLGVSDTRSDGMPRGH